MVRGNVFFALLILGILVALCSPATTAQKPQVTVAITPSVDVVVDPRGDFHVPFGTLLHWTVSVTIANPETNPDTFQGLAWSNNYDPSLAFVSAVADRGSVTYKAAPPAAHISWAIEALAPGESASLQFRLATRVNSAGQQLYRTLGCAAWESGAVLHYRLASRSGSFTLEFPARQRCVKEDLPWVQFSVTSRRDSHLPSPSCFVPEAARARVEIASNEQVFVTLQAFGHFEHQDSPPLPPIPTYYTWGDYFYQIGYRESLASGSLNGTVWTFGPASALDAGSLETLWTQICLASDHGFWEYEDLSLVTITLHSGSAYVAKP